MGLVFTSGQGEFSPLSFIYFLVVHILVRIHVKMLTFSRSIILPFAQESAQGVHHPDPNQLPKRPGMASCGFYARTGAVVAS